MQLSFCPKTPNFKAIYVTQSGEKAINEVDSHKSSSEESLLSQINRAKEERENDEYVDAVIAGEPDRLGRYNPVLYIKDKVQGKCYRSDFDMDSYYTYFISHYMETRDDGDAIDNTITISDSKDKKMTINFNTEEESRKLASYIHNKEYDSIPLKLVGALETSYKVNDMPTDDYAEFLKRFENAYGKPIQEAVPSIISDENNLIGSGREKSAYKLDKMPNYILCVVRDKYNPAKPITPFYKCRQILDYKEPDNAIAKNGNGMYIKRFTKGKSHSLPNWFNKYHNIEPINQDDVSLFISQLETLSYFPTKSYINFAKELKKMNEEKIRIDTINPNNILIDPDMQTINVIDTQEIDKSDRHSLMNPINGLSDMEAILMDSILFTKYYDMANDEDKAKLDKYGKAIIKKCGIAAQVSNLGNYPRNTLSYAGDIDEYMPMEDGSTRRGRVEEFREHFDGVVCPTIVSAQYDYYMAISNGERPSDESIPKDDKWHVVA